MLAGRGTLCAGDCCLLSSEGRLESLQLNPQRKFKLQVAKYYWSCSYKDEKPGEQRVFVHTVFKKCFKGQFYNQEGITIPQEHSSKFIFKERGALCKVRVRQGKGMEKKRGLVIQGLLYFSYITKNEFKHHSKSLMDGWVKTGVTVRERQRVIILLSENWMISSDSSQ